ncbi:MAG: rRNA maturation RNase YbeY, partial [Clostridium sp.]|nr:rRNA maturation RNase YbeY [Clostridium sp.]
MINIENEQNKVKLEDKDFSLIKNAVNQTLINEGVDYSVEVSVMIVDNKSIREINKETRGIDKETDVLSFPM